jgi:hypothetical protein
MKYANHIGYSDVNPFEIVRKISEKTIEIREMKATRDTQWAPEFHVGGFSAHCSNQASQRWIISSDETANILRIRLSKNRGWQDKFGRRFSLAEAPRKFYDYNF